MIAIWAVPPAAASAVNVALPRPDTTACTVLVPPWVRASRRCWRARRRPWCWSSDRRSRRPRRLTQVTAAPLTGFHPHR
jgi:hypothetical protein